MATAVLTPRVTEFLLGYPRARIDVLGSDLLVEIDDTLSPATAERLRGLTEGLLQRVPASLLTDDDA